MGANEEQEPNSDTSFLQLIGDAFDINTIDDLAQRFSNHPFINSPFHSFQRASLTSFFLINLQSLSTFVHQQLFHF